MPPITWRAPPPYSAPTSSNAAFATSTPSRSRSRPATPIMKTSARRSWATVPNHRQRTVERRAPAMISATIYLGVTHFLGLSEILLSPSFGISHDQTSIDRSPPDPGYIADRRGGLRYPRDLFDYSAALADAARARPAAQAAI